MIDTHSHLYDEAFDEDRDEAVARALDVGVELLLLPNIDEASILPMTMLYQKYPNTSRPMMGLHPTEVHADYSKVLQRMRERFVPGHPYVAVGEVGLDFYWDETYREEQIKAFQTQVEWALELDLPLMIHARSAHRELVDTLSPYRNTTLRGVFHCFGGTSEEAHELLTFQNFVLGIGGVVTYKKSTLPQTLKDVVPLSRIILETDAPYLAPTPHRGKRNESSFIVHTLEKVADIYQLMPKEVERVTDETTRTMFRL